MADEIKLTKLASCAGWGCEEFFCSCGALTERKSGLA